MVIGAIAGRIVGIVVEQFVYYYYDWFIFKEWCEVGVDCIIFGFYVMVGVVVCLGNVIVCLYMDVCKFEKEESE